KKFVIIGPESTGKSTLCSQLADHYKTSWVPEYAREYLLKNGTDYSYENLLTIAKGQIELEDGISNQVSVIRYQQSVISMKTETSNIVHPTSYIAHPHSLLFIDTDMYVMKVWCEFVFNKCHSWILNRIAERHYDGYLLCNTDVDWVPDALREYPDHAIRQKLYYYYNDTMINQAVPWVDISGSYSERFEKAINFVDNLI
ncbi:MAG: ATP-binding protein, partial [Ginsengibacter sp.]